MVNRNWQQFALLLIDVQQDFWNPELEQAFPDFQSNIARLLRFCRQEKLEVVHLREVFNPDGSDWLPRYRLRKRAVCVRGTPGADVLSVAAAQSGEMVMEKQTQDHPPLLDYLRSTGKRFILTAGLVTSVCVLLTAASASQLGFLVTVISDCCADYPEAHAIALRRYQGFMLELACLDELPQRWGEWVTQIERLA